MGWFSRLFGSKPNGVVFLEGERNFECEVVGESKYQGALNTIVGGKTEDGHEYECLAELVPEPRNPHDPNAIMVLIGGHLVGYLSRDHAKALSRILGARNLAGAQANALIVGGWSGRSTRDRGGHYGVKLDIPVH